MRNKRDIGLFKKEIAAIHVVSRQYQYNVRDTAAASRERRERELAEERRASLELQIEWDEQARKTKAAADEQPEKKKLKRELEREALVRLEDAARTPAQFQQIIEWWDRLDRNRERRERYYEISRSGDDVPLDHGASRNGVYVPRALSGVLTRQIRKGDFLDAIFYCPFEVSELVTEEYISTILAGLKDTQKEVLFLHDVCQFSTKLIGKIRGQTDRNIRKVYITIIKSIDKKLIPILKQRAADGEPLTLEERHFLEGLLDESMMD